MFENSLIELGAKRKPRSRWLSLPIAVLLHVVLLASVAFAQYWQIGNVAEPQLTEVFFVQADLPALEPASEEPAGPPPGPPSPPPDRQETQPEPATPAVVQPDVVPDQVPPTPASGETAIDVVNLAGGGDGSDPTGPFVPGSLGPGGGGCVGPHCGSGGGGEGPGEGHEVVSDAPLPVGGAVSRPEVIYMVHPVYTELARKARLQGSVIVKAIIDERGRVTNVEILKPLPMGLDKSAADAVQQWRFRPATLKGRPVKVYYSLTVNFQVQ
jgi:protein TonB